jgi:uncharacterized protein YcnI
MKRLLTLLMVASALAVVPGASARVTVDPDEVPAGSFARFVIRVANERQRAGSTTIVVQLPKEVSFVSFQPKPGWKRTTTVETLGAPVDALGEKRTERVATVSWAGGKIGPGEFDEFGISAKVPAEQAVLVFRVTQTYSDGEVVRWIGAPNSDTPAPRVTVTSALEAAPRVAGTAAAASTQKDGRSELDKLALGIGIAGLVAGLGALAITLARTPNR